MNVASVTFLAFGLGVAILYNLARPVAWRQTVLLLANLACLASFSVAPLTWIPYLGFLLLSYACYLVSRARRQGSLAYLILIVLVAFFWLKKYTFLPSSTFLESPYVTLGISYVLFRVLHLIIDTHDGVIEETVGPLTFLNYVLNFTAIISGPIQRFQDYASDQLRAVRPRLDIIDAGEAMERIIIGYFKISVLGFLFQTAQNNYLPTQSPTFAPSLGAGVIAGFAIIACYPLYLYCNFSGYTDIVIGVARFIRLTLPENFNRPFSATNFLDFWGHWHISLSSWLKTYVYSPLLKTLMGRFSAPAVAAYLGVISYFVTFFLVGVWHGRTSVFVVFGILQGGGVAANKLYQIQMGKWLGKRKYRELSEQTWYQAICRGLTFTYFAFSLVWFWSNWQQMAFIVHCFGLAPLALALPLIWMTATVVLAAWQWLRRAVLLVTWEGNPMVLSRYTRVVWGTALLMIQAIVLRALSVPAPDVVYKAF